MLHPGSSSWVRRWRYARCPTIWPGRLEDKSSLVGLARSPTQLQGSSIRASQGISPWNCPMWQNLPITLWPGMKIGQLCLLRLHQPAEHPYGSTAVGSKYQGRRGPTPSPAYSTLSGTAEPPRHQIQHVFVQLTGVDERRICVGQFGATAPCTLRPDLRCEVEGVAKGGSNRRPGRSARCLRGLRTSVPPLRRRPRSRWRTSRIVQVGVGQRECPGSCGRSCVTARRGSVSMAVTTPANSAKPSLTSVEQSLPCRQWL